MWDAATVRFRWLGRSDVETAIDLHRVVVHDFVAAGDGQPLRERRAHEEKRERSDDQIEAEAQECRLHRRATTVSALPGSVELRADENRVVDTDVVRAVPISPPRMDVAL